MTQKLLLYCSISVQEKTRSKMDIYDCRRDVTKEILKTRPSNSGTRREYARMRQEQSIKRLQANAASFVYEENPQHRKSITLEDAIKSQESEPEVNTFPFVDKTDNSDSDRASSASTRAVEAKEHSHHKHGARMCMMSAVVHMRCLAQRRAKSIQQLRKNPKTSLDEKLLNSQNQTQMESDEQDTDDDDVAKLRKCRYLRGVKEDKELTIEEIFG